MARTPPFFRHAAPSSGLRAPAPVAGRYPYHDPDECPEGQEVKRSGDWQYYFGHPSEERAQCARCGALNHLAP